MNHELKLKLPRHDYILMLNLPLRLGESYRGE
jgi:hypothetical protein